jgi:hypothetical protein
MSKLHYKQTNRTPTIDTVEEVTNLVQWTRNNPEQAFETGLKIVGFGLLVLTLAAIFME